MFAEMAKQEASIHPKQITGNKKTEEAEERQSYLKGYN